MSPLRLVTSAHAAAARARAWAADSPIAPLAGKALAWLVAFVALALVGSGAATGLLPGAGKPDAQMAAMGSLPGVAAAVTSEPHAQLAASAEPHADPPAPGHGADARDAGDAGAPADAAPPGAAGVTADGKVILNAAREEDLRRLPGIGPSKARAILALRDKVKRFKRVEDLLRVKGIGRRSLARLRPLIVLDAPAP